MTATLVLDSSILVAALKADEEKHSECKRLLELIKEGRYFAIEPYTVLVEVVAAVKRRTGSEMLAERIETDLINMSNIEFLDIVENRALGASQIARKSSIRGMDAVVIQICKEMDSRLVTLDDEMVEKSKGIVETKTLDSLL